MNKRNDKAFTVPAATAFIFNSVFNGDEDAFGEEFEKAHNATIKDAIKAVIQQVQNLNTLSGSQLTTAFSTLWDQTYPNFKLAQLQASDDSSEGSDDEEIQNDIIAFFKRNNETLSGEMVNLLAQQYQSILQWLNAGKACVRWTFLNTQQRNKICNRLLEGMCAVSIHLITFHNLNNPQQLQQCLSTSTIILHGSYLFGAENYQPNDMDVIIISNLCPCSTAALPAMSRRFAGDIMTIGHQCSIADIMAGIPLCSTILLDSYSQQKLLAEALEALDQYLRSIPSETNLSKQYRKLINCALIIQHLLTLTGQNPSAELQKYIDQANNSITALAPKASSDTNGAIYQACKAARKQL